MRTMPLPVSWKLAASCLQCPNVAKEGEVYLPEGLKAILECVQMTERGRETQTSKP